MSILSMIHLGALVVVALLVLCSLLLSRPDRPLPRYAPVLVFFLAFLVRILLTCHFPGHENDFFCFGTWANLLYQDGLGAFYTHDILVDYPPASLYFLWPVGALSSLFNIDFFSRTYRILLRLPAILFDLGAGAVFYQEARHLSWKDSHALIIAASYLFSPCVLINSSVWGQVDSLLVLPLLLMCLSLMRGKMPQAYLAYGIGVLLKPQMVMFTPVLLVGILDHVFLKDFSARKFFYNLACGLGVIAGMALLCMPYHLDLVIKQFTTTLGSYPFGSVNAFNFWHLVGRNFVNQYRYFFFLSSKNWGLLVILGVVFCVFLMALLMRDNDKKYPILAAFIIVTMFTFAARMHERYLFSGLACVLLSYLCRPSRKLLVYYGALSVVHFYNVACVLAFRDNTALAVTRTVSIATIACALFLYYILLHDYCGPLSSLWSGRRGDAAQDESRKAS